MTNFLTTSLGLAALIAFAVPASAADAPKAEAAKAEAPAAPSPEAVAAGKSIDWEKVDAKAKKEYMKKNVLPTMKKLFVAVDKKHYANDELRDLSRQEGRGRRSSRCRAPSCRSCPADRSRGLHGAAAEEARGGEVHGDPGQADDGGADRQDRVDRDDARRVRLLRLPHQGRDRRGAAGAAARRGTAGSARGQAGRRRARPRPARGW